MSEITKKNMSNKIAELVSDISQSCNLASKILAKSNSEIKDNAILNIARNLRAESRYIIDENQRDVELAKQKGLSEAMIDRLTLTNEGIDKTSSGLEEIVRLTDPVGEITKMWKRPNGLLVGRMRIPLGVIGIVYESRPNVTADAAGLCLKSGNGVILRGGSETISSNLAISNIIKRSLKEAGLPEECVQLIPVTDRDAVLEMLKQEDYIDLIIPRGGEGLIRFVSENSHIPVLKHYKGVCHVYVDRYADIDMALNICVNAKTQMPSVCNAAETLLIHTDIAETFLPKLYEIYSDLGVEIRGCEHTKKILPDIKLASEDDWYKEYLDLIINIKIVGDMDEAIGHIEKYGSMHTESIVTQDYTNSRRFLNDVNSSTVMVNASTRFSDGFELGLGAEIGISTTKLHSFGPMGIEELTTTKFIIFGDGQIRQ